MNVSYSKFELRVLGLVKLETEEQKEAAHQINRRTEFQVIATDYEP